MLRLWKSESPLGSSCAYRLNWATQLTRGGVSKRISQHAQKLRGA